MSREILIVGSGFMGTSMAHALKNFNITCFETNEAYLATLKNLNIYKNIFSDVSDIKGEFALIIICTRQKDVLEHISYFSSKFPESLITDISSSKNFLQEADLPPNFISSHPICGSHKVGGQICFLQKVFRTRNIGNKTFRKFGRKIRNMFKNIFLSCADNY